MAFAESQLSEREHSGEVPEERGCAVASSSCQAVQLSVKPSQAELRTLGDWKVCVLASGHSIW